MLRAHAEAREARNASQLARDTDTAANARSATPQINSLAVVGERELVLENR
jgi:hypothetical protein